MRIIQNFSNDEYKELLNDFYTYFNTGFEFEEFLKPFLEALGLTEVVVTQKTRDGGIDLIAEKSGLTEINNIDSVKYRIQAKRNKPSTTIAPGKIDELRGNLLFNEKGLFITTSKVTENAKEKAITKDPSKPVFVIDGYDLIKICIDKQIGFAYKPVFSEEALDKFTAKSVEATQHDKISTAYSKLSFVSKTITLNDIRCSLLSIPRFIFDKIIDNTKKHSMEVIINGKDTQLLTFSPSRKYLYIPASYNFFKQYGCAQNDGTLLEKQAEWAIDIDQKIYINIIGVGE